MEAISSLSGADYTTLRSFAAWRMRKLGVAIVRGKTAEDLLQEALVATLEGRRAWREGITMVKHLSAVMYSVAGHWRKRGDASEENSGLFWDGDDEE
jgi:DNA-directed RNA polymerase specialized sigma24 family protein